MPSNPEVTRSHYGGSVQPWQQDNQNEPHGFLQSGTGPGLVPFSAGPQLYRLPLWLNVCSRSPVGDCVKHSSLAVQTPVPDCHQEKTFRSSFLPSGQMENPWEMVKGS